MTLSAAAPMASLPVDWGMGLSVGSEMGPLVLADWETPTPVLADWEMGPLVRAD